MQVRPLETISGTDKIDWHKPFLMKVDDIPQSAGRDE